MSSGFAVDPGVLLGGLLLIVGVVASGLAERFRVPSLLLFLGLGMAVADEGLGLVRFDDAALAQNIAAVALVIILFEGGLGTDPAAFRSCGAPSALLATVGVVITAFVVAGFTALVLGWEFQDALLLGSVIASTDAAAVFAALRSSQLPRRTMRILQLESGMNDPVAVLMTVGMVEVWRGEPDAADWALFLVQQLGGGLVVGVAIGLSGRRFLDAAAGASSAAVLTLAIAAVSYGIAAVGGASGFLAVYLTGVLLARSDRRVRGVLFFHESLASTAQGVLFLLLGILVFPSELIDDLDVSIPVAIVLVLVARPLAVFSVLVWSRTPVARMTVISWAGLRGAVPVVLATIPFTAGHPSGSAIFDATFVVVLLSVAVQAPTVGPLARRLGVDEPADVRVAAELVPVDSLGADVIEISIPEDSRLNGRSLRSAPPPGDARVVLLHRGEQTLVPSGDTELACGDRLLVVGFRSEQLADLEHWSGT
ncbi:MAG: potassium/proton antiporter [Actinomycetota bacterium]